MKLRRIKLGIWWSDGRPRPSSRAGTPGSPPASIKIGSHCALALALSMALAISSVGGQIVDRVVANVNGHVVLQSDWEQEIAFEAFSNARDPDSFTAAERNAALDRLIDRELLREQVRPSQPAPAEQVAARVVEVRKLHPDCATDAGWHAKLQRYGLTQSALEKRLGDQIQLMKLVEDRLRPSIQIDQRAVETYYNDQLLPDMKRAGNRATPLTEVFGRIKDLLAERKMNELLSGWLASLRSGSHILTPESTAGERNR
ncbi:MAG: SurA N-terminal domain-containing protein [Terriglobales bacterium]